MLLVLPPVTAAEFEVVTGEGAPVVAASVIVIDEYAGILSVVGTTDAEGRLRMDGLPLGSLRFHVSARAAACPA